MCFRHYYSGWNHALASASGVVASRLPGPPKVPDLYASGWYVLRNDGKNTRGVYRLRSTTCVACHTTHIGEHARDSDTLKDKIHAAYTGFAAPPM